MYVIESGLVDVYYGDQVASFYDLYEVLNVDILQGCCPTQRW